MENSKMLNRRNTIINTLMFDCFAIFVADFNTGKIEMVRCDYNKDKLTKLLAENNSDYEPFIEAYRESFTQRLYDEDPSSDLSIANIRSIIRENYTHTIIFRQNFGNDELRPTEVRFIDMSKNGDGSKCIITLRFVQQIICRNVNENEQLISSLIKYYTAIFRIDLDNDTFSILRSENLLNEKLDHNDYTHNSFSNTISSFCTRFVRDGDRAAFLETVSCDNIIKRLKKDPSLSLRYRVKSGDDTEYFELRIIRTTYEENRHIAIMTIRNIDKEIREELKYQIEIEKANEELHAALDKQILYQRELKKAMESANFADQSKTNFLSRMSHDIRTPMNAIIGMTAIAGAHINETDKLRDCLSKISSASRHLLSIINNILDMTKIESGQIQVKEEVFKISDLFIDLVDMLSSDANDRGLVLNINNGSLKHQSVIGDYTYLQQAFLNILTNSVHYTPQGGHITVTINETGSDDPKFPCFEFIFEDTGIGMSEELVSKVFEPFERGSDPQILCTQGTGLGLPITRNIIRLMGGTIDVKSAPNKGTTVTVRLNLKLADKQTDLSEITVSRDGGAGFLNEFTANDFSDKRVLLVEDNDLSREIASEIILLTSAELDIAVDGLQAVEMVRTLPDGYYDIIFMDVQMPVLNGYDAASEIRSINSEYCRTVPIIAMTANTFEEDVKNALNAGMNEHIGKPIDLKQLNSVMMRWLS